MNTDHDGLPDLSPLERQEAPPRDLWPEIAAAIGRTRGHARYDRIAAPARVLLAVSSLAASLVIGIAAGRSPFFLDRGLPGYVRTVNADYRRTERLVLYRLEGSRLSEDNILEIRQNLRIMDSAADRLMELLRDNPDSRLFDDRFDLVNRARFEFLETVRAMLGGGTVEGRKSREI